ncbi:sigma-70 family RNA polymerase sigma factor [Actinomadura hibisca]|uniref:sigma-70 family RNA polymerase sigma factor n=1 Tax=Actinomadura hibisca TaxID=68565 RepID=UPI0012FCBFA5|nr:sigma-70 family RNA polymerase sigma factor [Actinomadura hibisca]
MGGAPESDADLMTAARTGDERASGELYRRHHAAVLAYARGLVRDQHLAEDLTSEAFARTFAALREGRGPREACRPYLYTVVRNTAVDWARAGRRTVVTDEVAQWADLPAEELPDVDERDTLVRAFRSLPERWQTVLWHTVIEDEPVQRVAELLGMGAGAVTQLSFRAREGLRLAFLAASVEGHPDCAQFTAQLAASMRRPGRRRSRALRRHLESCDRCRRASQEMADLNGRLRSLLPIGLIMLDAPSGVQIPAAAAGLPGWVVPAGVAGAAAVIAALLFTTIGDGPAKPPDASSPLPSSGPPSAAATPIPTLPDPAPAGQTLVPKKPKVPKRRAGAEPGRPGPGAGGGAGAGTASVIRNTTLRSCLVPDGADVVQRRVCSGAEATWRRKNVAGGFTLASASTGKCMARGRSAPGVPWEGGAEYTVTTAACGGPNQVWKMVQLNPGVTRLANGDGWFLQASWSGLRPVTLKPSSFAGVAAQGWTVEGA